LCELSLERPLIDDVEKVALLNSCTVGECLPLEQPCDLAADLDGVRRLGLRHVFVEDRYRLGARLDHGDFRRR